MPHPTNLLVSWIESVSDDDRRALARRVRGRCRQLAMQRLERMRGADGSAALGLALLIEYAHDLGLAATELYYLLEDPWQTCRDAVAALEAAEILATAEAATETGADVLRRFRSIGSTSLN
jgi:hypothetical protein